MKLKKKSILDGKTSLNDVAGMMIDHVIDEFVRKNHHIVWISKRQILFGGNALWKTAGSFVGAGLFRHAGISRPSVKILADQKNKYGYSMQWPPPGMDSFLGQVMRSQYIKPWVFKGTNDDIRYLWGLGYVDEQGRLRKEFGQGVAGYFIYMADSRYRKKQSIWLAKQPEWVRIQWTRCGDTYITAVDRQVKASQAKVTVNQRLLSVDEYREIKVDVNPELLTWRN